MVTDRGIDSVVAHKLVEVFRDRCIESVPDDDDSKADHVVLGKPTVERRDEIVIAVMMEHPLGRSQSTDKVLSSWSHTSDEEARPYTFPPESIGGMLVDVIIGTVWISIREMEDYEDSIDIISSVAERVRAAINRDSRLKRLCDDFGNMLFKLETFRGQGHETGGKGVAINHRWVDFRGLVARSNRRDDVIGSL